MPTVLELQQMPKADRDAWIDAELQRRGNVSNSETIPQVMGPPAPGQTPQQMQAPAMAPGAPEIGTMTTGNPTLDQLLLMGGAMGAGRRTGQFLTNPSGIAARLRLGPQFLRTSPMVGRLLPEAMAGAAPFAIGAPLTALNLGLAALPLLFGLRGGVPGAGRAVPPTTPGTIPAMPPQSPAAAQVLSQPGAPNVGGGIDDVVANIRNAIAEAGGQPTEQMAARASVAAPAEASPVAAAQADIRQLVEETKNDVLGIKAAPAAAPPAAPAAVTPAQTAAPVTPPEIVPPTGAAQPVPVAGPSPVSAQKPAAVAPKAPKKAKIPIKESPTPKVISEEKEVAQATKMPGVPRKPPAAKAPPAPKAEPKSMGQIAPGTELDIMLTRMTPPGQARISPEGAMKRGFLGQNEQGTFITQQGMNEIIRLTSLRERAQEAGDVASGAKPFFTKEGMSGVPKTPPKAPKAKQAQEFGEKLGLPPLEPEKLTRKKRGS